MNYVFFDVECAQTDGRGGKVYSIGYIITDQQLKVVQKEKDILVNPNVECWDWYVAKNILAYSKKHLESMPCFDKCYNKIRNIFKKEGVVICGFSVKDDIRYLESECVRYGLPSLNLKCFDVKLLSEKLVGEKMGLEIAYMKWCNRLPANLHRSDIDALFTYEIARAICKKTKKHLHNYKQKIISFMYRVLKNKNLYKTKKEKQNEAGTVDLSIRGKYI